MYKTFDYNIAPEAAVGENPLQRTLREALLRIRRVGHQELSPADSEQLCDLVSVCGLPNNHSAPSATHADVAELILWAMAKGCGDEDEFSCLPYPEVIHSIEVFADAVSLCDARACALLELLHAYAGSDRLLSEIPLELPSVRYEV